MKKIITLLLICFTIKASAQNSIGISEVHILGNFSPYNVKVRGSEDGVQLDYRIDVTNKTDGAVTELNLKQIILKTSYFDMSNVYQGAQTGIFGKDINFMVGAGFSSSENKRSKFIFAPEVGLRYSTKDFYNTGNQNEIIGSHLNIVMGVAFNLVTYLTDDLGFQLGAEVTHASNGRTQLPNVGINQINISAGIFHPFDIEKKNDTSFRYKLKNFEISALIGYSGEVKAGYYINPKTGRGMFPDTALQGKTPHFKTYVLSANYNFSDVQSVNLKFGTDLIYRVQTLNYDHFFQTYQGQYSSFSNLNVGIYTGIGFQIGRVNISGNEGYLVYAQQPQGGKRLYTALEAKVAITENIGIKIRSQWNDFLSAGLAFNF